MASPLRSQAPHGIGDSGFDGLEADRQQGDQDRHRAGNQEYTPAQVDVIVIIPEPVRHGPPGHGRRDQDGNHHEGVEEMGPDVIAVRIVVSPTGW
jgi:hypothetical protein